MVAHKFSPTTTLSAATLRHLLAIGLVLAMISPVAGFNSAFVLEQEFKRMFPFQEVTVKSQPRGYYIKLLQQNDDLSVQQVQILVPTEGEDNIKVVVTLIYNQRQRILAELNQAPKISLNGIKTVSIQD